MNFLAEEALKTIFNKGIDILKLKFYHIIIHYKLSQYFAQERNFNDKNLEKYISTFIQTKIPKKADISKKKRKLQIFTKFIVSNFDKKMFKDINGIFKPIIFKSQVWNETMYLFKKYITLEGIDPKWKIYVNNICKIIDESFFVSQCVNDQNIIKFNNQKQILDILKQIKDEIQNKNNLENLKEIEKLDLQYDEINQNFNNIFEEIEEIGIHYTNSQQENKQKIGEVNEKISKLIDFMTNINFDISILYMEIMGNRELSNQISKKISIIKSEISEEINPNIREILNQLQTLNEFRDYIKNSLMIIEKGGKSNNELILKEFKSYEEIFSIKFDQLQSLIINQKKFEFDNYDRIMNPHPSELPQFFRGLEDWQAGIVFEQDITNDFIIKVDALYTDIYDHLRTMHNVCITGTTGISKTTHAKMLLYHFRQELLVKNDVQCFIIEDEASLETFFELESTEFPNTSKFIVFFDDLHRYSPKKISKFYIQFFELKNRLFDRMYFITTSRRKIETLISDHFKERSAVQLLQLLKSHEILCNKMRYKAAYSSSEKKLFDKCKNAILNKKATLNTTQRLDTIYERFHGNFIFLGMALKFGDFSAVNDDDFIVSIYRGIQMKLEREFEDILKTERNNGRIANVESEIGWLKECMEVFLSVCIRSLYDDPVSTADLSGNRRIIKYYLEILGQKGIFQKDTTKSVYVIAHARLAQLFIEMLVHVSKSEIFQSGLEKYSLPLTSLKIGNYSFLDHSLLSSILKILPNLTKLKLNNNKITNLVQLANLKKLTYLNLEKNKITDLTPLMKLTKLTNLNLGGNQIIDITPLANLTRLTYLNLEKNKIMNLKPLANLTRLTYLNLEKNKIVNLKPLANLIKLTELNISRNNIWDPQPLAELTNLTHLNLGKNQISDLKPLTNLTNLTHLNLGKNQISELLHLANLTNLTTLFLGGNKIKKLRPVSNLKNLTKLYLGENEIETLEQLVNLIKITELYLDGNQISDLTPLVKFTKLTYLNLERNQIQVITPLANLTNLTVLYLDWNHIIDLKPIAKETNLNVLYLNGNKIWDLTPLANLTNLTYLSLKENNITNLMPLANLIKLTYLNLERNEISELLPLANLTNLTVLYIDWNPITDLEPLANLTKLTYIT